MAQNGSILVVEDEALLRMDVIDQLTDAGFSVYEAANSKEALAILAEHEDIRLIFTDIDMPGGIDGLALAALVRTRWPPIKIIVTSGHRIVDIVDLPDGSAFHSKPFRPSAVISSIREMLSGY